jgi:hypothetical protein
LTGGADHSTAFTSHILALAHRFQVADLVDLCINHLVGKLEVNNLAENIALAHLPYAESLLKPCIDFLLDKPARLNRFRDTQGYKVGHAHCVGHSRPLRRALAATA